MILQECFTISVEWNVENFNSKYYVKFWANQGNVLVVQAYVLRVFPRATLTRKYYRLAADTENCHLAVFHRDFLCATLT